MVNETGRYFGDTKEAFSVGTWRGWWLITTWFLYPVAIQTVLHPSRSIQFLQYSQGLDVRYEFTTHQLVAGELAALAALASLSLSMFMATILLYRKAGFWFRTWPLVGVATGFFGNLGWWIATQNFDPVGALAGLSPLSLSVVIFAVCEWQGREFVFGKGAARAGA
jgi:hypothetical protein